MKRIDLVKSTLTEEGELFTRIYRPLRDDLSDEQLDRILDYMDKVAQIIAELEEGNENE